MSVATMARALLLTWPICCVACGSDADGSQRVDAAAASAAGGVGGGGGGTAGRVSSGGATSGGRGTGSPGTCESLCPLVANSGCSGAGSLQECLAGCQADIVGPCASSLQALLDCTSASPVTACSTLDIVYFPDCEGEQAAYFDC
jgi:hypothetical protein